MAWTTSAAMLTYAANELKVLQSVLPPLWTDISADAVDQGYDQLVTYICSMGYSAGQLAAPPDQGAAWNLSQGLYLLGGFGGGFADYPREWFDRFNVVKQLDEGGGWALIFGGVPLPPDGSSEVGGIRHGQITSVAQTARGLIAQIYGGNCGQWRGPGCGGWW